MSNHIFWTTYYDSPYMIRMNISGNDVRKDIQSKWHEYLNKYGNLFSSDHISGSSPPSVFVGSYGYPR